MHGIDEKSERMIRSVLAYAENRLRLDPVPLDQGTLTPAQLEERLRDTIRTDGRAVDEVLGPVHVGDRAKHHLG